MSTIVLVHGGWVGGWIWTGVAAKLRARGHDVYVPTLTGLGERAHLTGPQVDLDTHIRDVAAVLEYQDLQDVVLVGHSYGGMVITGVAETSRARVSRLIYLDAFLPLPGESVADMLPREYLAAFRQIVAHGDGWRLPLPFPFEAFGDFSENEMAWMKQRITDQPFATVTSPLQLLAPAGAGFPCTYVYCAVKPMGLFETSKRRAGEAGWPIVALESMHGALATEPDMVAGLLDELVVAAAPAHALSAG